MESDPARSIHPLQKEMMSLITETMDAHAMMALIHAMDQSSFDELKQDLSNQLAGLQEQIEGLQTNLDALKRIDDESEPVTEQEGGANKKQKKSKKKRSARK